jgi:hypothetical protein
MTAARRGGARAPARQRPDNPRRVPADAGDEHRGRHGPDHAGKLPASFGSYSSQLAALDGTNPNGRWWLYVLDDHFEDGGQIGGGWRLTIKARVLRQRRTTRGPEPLVAAAPLLYSPECVEGWFLEVCIQRISALRGRREVHCDPTKNGHDTTSGGTG